MRNHADRTIPVQLSEVVTAYRSRQGLSLRGFAAALNSKLINTGISYETVRRWEAAEAGYGPEIPFLFECIATYDDWRGVFARDSLAALYPDLVGRVIEIHPLTAASKPK